MMQHEIARILEVAPWLASWLAAIERRPEDLLDINVSAYTERDYAREAAEPDSPFQQFRISGYNVTLDFIDRSSYPQDFTIEQWNSMTTEARRNALS